MIQSGLGFIDASGKIKLPHDVLRPLSIRYNSFLWGIYYPKSEQTDTVPDSKLTAAAKHDFMITPVPPELWRVSARIILYLNRDKGVMAKIAEFFARDDVKISIIHAKSSRSSHHFSTWVLHVVIVPLLSEQLNYDKNLGYNIEVKQYLAGVVYKGLKDLHESQQKLKNVLLFDKYGVDKSIETYPNNELHFFDWIMNQKKQAFRPFPIKVLDDGTIEASDDDFRHQLKKISQDSGEKEDYLLNTPVFAEFDSRGLNMRLFIFPKTVRPHFFEIGIQYEYHKDKEADYSCIGLIASVTHCISENGYNIWHSSNYTVKSTPNCETGKFIYLVEDTDERRIFDNEYKLNNAIGKRINEETLGNRIADSKIEIINVSISQLTTKKAEEKIKASVNRNFENDVFISFSQTDHEMAVMIRDFLDKKGLKCSISTEIKPSQDFYEVIGNNLRSSREMILLYSKAYHKSNWRKAEQGVFWALKRTITPILVHDMPPGKIDKFLERINHIPLLNIGDPNFRQDMETKLEKLVNDIKERKETDFLDFFEKMYGK